MLTNVLTDVHYIIVPIVLEFVERVQWYWRHVSYSMVADLKSKTANTNKYIFIFVFFILMFKTYKRVHVYRVWCYFCLYVYVNSFYGRWMPKSFVCPSLLLIQFYECIYYQTYLDSDNARCRYINIVYRFYLAFQATRPRLLIASSRKLSSYLTFADNNSH